MNIDFNRPETWLNSEIHTPPSFDVKNYQILIDQICGLTPSGKSTVLLSWCPAIENYSHRYCEWDQAGIGTKTHLRGLYKFKTLYDPEGNPIDIPPPRWALKQWQSGAQYIATDELSRWQKAESNFKDELTENGLKKVAQQVAYREVRPPYPKEGRYIPLLRIGKHNGYCCDAEKKNGNICYGEYRIPDEAYLEILRSAFRIREDEKGQNPNEPISAKTLMEAAKEAAEIEEQKRLASKQLISNIIDENWDEIISTDPDSLKKFSFPAFKKQNGILIPK